MKNILIPVGIYVNSLPNIFVGQQSSKYSSSASSNPPCEHGVPSRIVQVKKDGTNKVNLYAGATLCNREDNIQVFK